MISIFRQLLVALLIAALLFPAASESKAISARRATVTYDYDAFGILLHSTGSTPNNYLFAVEQFDPDLGLYYNRARYLNTSTGRFWTTDSFDGTAYEPLSLHKYLYAQADPIGNIDPSGHVSSGEATFAAGTEATIGAEEDQVALSIYQTAFRTTLYAGEEAVYSTPSLWVRVAAGLVAAGIAAASIFQAFSSPGELPDVGASQDAILQNGFTPIMLYRDTSGTAPADFKWRGPDKEKDGLSFYDYPFGNPEKKKFSVGFKAYFRGAAKVDGALGGFAEPELYGIGFIYTPRIGGDGHWSVPMTPDVTISYAERFSQAAKRIKKEGGVLSNPGL